MIRNLAIAAVTIGACGIGSLAAAQDYQYLTRQQIRAMPILERPSRPGHFYGNTVRRMNARKMQQAATNPWQMGSTYAPPQMPPMQVTSEAPYYIYGQ